MTDYLFAQPSFLSGLGRCLDIGGQFDAYNTSRTPEAADARAMHADFSAVGRDIAAATKQFAAEHSADGVE